MYPHSPRMELLGFYSTKADGQCKVERSSHIGENSLEAGQTLCIGEI